MRKILPFLIIGILIVSSFDIVMGFEEYSHRDITVRTPSIKMTYDEDYIEISFNDSNGETSYLLNPGQPVIPRMVKVFELPFGIHDISIKVTPTTIEELHLNGEIKPASHPIPLTEIKFKHSFPVKDQNVYRNPDFFPYTWYSYNVGCGINGIGKHVTYVTVYLYPIRYSPPTYSLKLAKKMDIKISFKQPDKNWFPVESKYDLVIIAPQVFSQALQPLIDHKNNMGVKTILKTTEEIYQEYPGRDKPEQIKYFIKNALEQWGVKYVLLVGGLKSIVYAKPKDDRNSGETGWYLPVRYANLLAGEPSYLSDLYYADIYKEGGEFEDWDSNGNGIFAEWTDIDGQPEDILDLYPDVALGRLACRNIDEVKAVVNKIIRYESTSPSDKPWFKKMIVVSGDGFLDQQDLNIKWDTNGLPDGEYTIYAQSINPEGEKGPIDIIHITVDKTKPTNLTFNHDDYLNPALQNGYPAIPIAKIVSVSNGNILGNTDYHYTPNDREAYCNVGLFWWANVSYVEGVLTIRGKSYDPKPYGNVASIHVWVNNSNGETVFSDWRNNTEMYYEGEWVTGEKVLNGRGGALYYMPDDFKREIVWTSNGNFSNMDDVIHFISKGSGFLFFSGHGSPNVWANHYPGVPGNRQHGSVTGLAVSQVSYFFPYIKYPLLPMRELSNKDMLPITVVGGCHNSMFNVSLIPSVLDLLFLYMGKNIWMHTYGRPTPECFSWYLVKLPDTGAIASMGNTGYGWGWEGEWCTVGAGDSWITSEFFRQYGEHGYDTLGVVYAQTLTSYISNFKEFTLPQCWWSPDFGWDWIDQKTVQQWVLLGDPSLNIGGYT